MRENVIQGSDLQIYRADVFKDPNSKGSHLNILITDEYIKSMNYQKVIKEQGRFYIGGNILYLLLSELFDYITVMFNKIRLDDVNINDENRTLLFLRKFSRSSETIEKKIEDRMKNPGAFASEIFEIHIAGLQNNITFSRMEGQTSKMSIALPVNYLYNRLISHMDKMQYTDLMQLDDEIRKTFLERFSALNQKVRDKKQQIEIKYALELAQERIRDLEKENTSLHEKISHLEYQNKLYKRSYFSLKNRFSDMTEQNRPDDQDLEEI